MRCGRACKYDLFDCFLFSAKACETTEDDLAINLYEAAACSEADETVQDMSCYGLKQFDSLIDDKSYGANGCWIKNSEDGDCYIGNPECMQTDCASSIINIKVRIDVFTEDPDNDWDTIRSDFESQEGLENNKPFYVLGYQSCFL